MILTHSLTAQQNLDHTLFSWAAQGGLAPIVAKKAKGVYLFDQNGKQYLDFSSQLMNVNIGHGDERVIEVVAEQMTSLSYAAPSFATEIRGRLGQAIADVMPADLNKVFFTLGGADAIENAIKLARVVTGKHKILTQYRSYHGGTLGAMSAGGDPRKHTADAQQVPNIVHVENPYYYRCPWYSSSMEECGQRALKNLEQIILYEGPQNIAALLFEGESGTSGCIKYPALYLQGVKRLCDQYNILLIVDEVMSGFGRTGAWFGFNHHGITPDIVCMAKGLTSGYLPLGAICISDTLAEGFDEQFLPLGLTYSAHAACCAAAMAVIDVYHQDDLIARAADMGRILDQKMEDLIANHPSIGDWRNTGMLGCLELVKNRETREPQCRWNAPPDQLGVMPKVSRKLRELGMFTFVKW
ncbi:MAG: aminotransferase class III-fold pyridoxal phosphate-dependent enzyme, partial [Saprospiraceae bacterium]|nr:aminotransferase class III-fold pyridoxal phosphate-dependent enzyme [Saprospiraceae bacterium]